jgi:hypothetical protein
MTVVPAMRKTVLIGLTALWAVLGPWTARETRGQAGLLTPTSTGQA